MVVRMSRGGPFPHFKPLLLPKSFPFEGRCLCLYDDTRGYYTAHVSRDQLLQPAEMSDLVTALFLNRCLITCSQSDNYTVTHNWKKGCHSNIHWPSVFFNCPLAHRLAAVIFRGLVVGSVTWGLR